MGQWAVTVYLQKTEIIPFIVYVVKKKIELEGKMKGKTEIFQRKQLETVTIASPSLAFQPTLGFDIL